MSADGPSDDQYWSTTLLLVRHGQARSTDGSYGPETPLSEQGRRQAEAVAGSLAAESPPAAVYTSPWPRAADTAVPIGEALGLEAVADPRLAEFGIGAGTLAAAQQRADLAFWHPQHKSPLNGESLSEFKVRVAQFCEEAVERHRRDRIVVVAHSGTIEAALQWSLSLAPEHPWGHEFDITNGSITEIEFWPRGRVAEGAPRDAALKRIGDVAHLSGLVSDL